ncbi:MAG: FkbM family methyltransferase [Pseudomonadota bacterium]
MSDHDPSYWGVLTRLVPPGTGRVLVDVGANCGDMTQLFTSTHPDARILALEPNPEVHAGLSRRFAANHRVRCIHAALSNGNGTTRFHVNRIPATSSFFPRVTDSRRYFSSEDALDRMIEVPTLTLDTLARQENLTHIDLLKLDTQGAERVIFEGAAECLSRQMIDVIYTEFFCIPHYQDAPLLHHLWALLDSHGYSLYDLFKGPHGRNGQLRFGDAIFVSQRFRARVLDSLSEED